MPFIFSRLISRRCLNTALASCYVPFNLLCIDQQHEAINQFMIYYSHFFYKCPNYRQVMTVCHSSYDTKNQMKGLSNIRLKGWAQWKTRRVYKCKTKQIAYFDLYRTQLTKRTNCQATCCVRIIKKTMLCNNIHIVMTTVRLFSMRTVCNTRRHEERWKNSYVHKCFHTNEKFRHFLRFNGILL